MINQEANQPKMSHINFRKCDRRIVAFHKFCLFVAVPGSVTDRSFFGFAWYCVVMRGYFIEEIERGENSGSQCPYLDSPNSRG